MAKVNRKDGRFKRHKRVRKTVKGLPGKERLCVYKSLRHIYAQVIDDVNGRIVCSASSLSPESRKQVSCGGNIRAAELVGGMLVESCKKCGVEKVVFDRGGYPYHGRIKALAEAARKGGLVF